jgi:hypothetical protein
MTSCGRKSAFCRNCARHFQWIENVFSEFNLSRIVWLHEPAKGMAVPLKVPTPARVAKS